MRKSHIRLLYPFTSSSTPAISEKDLLINTPEWTSIAEFKSTLSGIYQTNQATGSPYVLALCGADNHSLFLIKDGSASTLDEALAFWRTQGAAEFSVEKLIRAAGEVISDVNAQGGVVVCNGVGVLKGDPEWTDLCASIEGIEGVLSDLGVCRELLRDDYDGSVDDYLSEM